MSRTSPLRQELKQRFYPFAKSLGFQVDARSWDFRRITATGVDVCDIQWEKYGRPRFVVNFGKTTSTTVTHFGKVIPPEKVLSYMGSQTGRLKPGVGSSTASWFRQDRSFFQRVLLRQTDRPASEVVDELIALFPEVEIWFKQGHLGPHMKLIPYPWLPNQENHDNDTA